MLTDDRGRPIKLLSDERLAEIQKSVEIECEDLKGFGEIIDLLQQLLDHIEATRIISDRK